MTVSNTDNGTNINMAKSTLTSSSSSTALMTQRIYIGGIQPPRLTVEMVQKRLQSTLPQIEFLSFDQSKSYGTNNWGYGDSNTNSTFFYATVRLIPIPIPIPGQEKSESQEKEKQQQQIQQQSPVEIVAKQYHNVKWKGCTLRVEQAKLHFLQRLEMERKENRDIQLAKEQMELKQVKKMDMMVKEPIVALQLQQHQQATIDDATATVTTTDTKSQTPTEPTNTINKTKRHLRIKKRFGEEAYLVDTKPIETTTQKDLHLSLKKMREKHAKHLDIYIQSKRRNKNSNGGVKEEIKVLLKEEKNLSLKSKAFLNRAIHIHFHEGNVERLVHSSILYEDDDGNIVGGGGDMDNAFGNGKPKEVSDNDSDSSVPSSTDDDDEVEQDGLLVGVGHEQEYSWSDEEDEDGPTTGKKVHKEVVEDNDNDNDNGPVSSEESESLQIAQTQTTTVDRSSGEQVHVPNDNSDNDDDDDDSASDEKENGYAWSDSDSDSDDSHTKRFNANIRNFDYNASKHDDLDEFASEFKDSANDNNCTFSSLKYGEITFADETDPDFAEEPFSLHEDVGMNLQMVTMLFPELLGAKPERFDEKGEKAESVAPAGWDASGLMQRYDPTKVTATVFEVKTEQVEKSDAETKADATPGNDTLMEHAEEGASDNDPDSSSSSEDDDDDAETKPDKSIKEKLSAGAPSSKETESKEQIYEQKKLENIFQQERTSIGTTGFQMSSMFDKSAIVSKPQVASSSGGGSFSFGFMPDFPKEEKATAVKVNTEVADTKMKPSEDVSASQETLKIINEVTGVKSAEPEPPKLKQRRGMTFGDEELEVYTTNFYNANEGIDAILASLEENVIDEVDKEKWDEERKILTMDWKRKQNNAVSKQKKRIKIR